MGFSWQSPPNEVFAEGLKQYERSIYEALYQLTTAYAPRIESWMKQNARWIDRTGNLRASLYAQVQRLVNEIAIYIDYGLSYGVYLEMNPRFSIIGPALSEFSPRIWNSVKELLR